MTAGALIFFIVVAATAAIVFLSLVSDELVRGNGALLWRRQQWQKEQEQRQMRAQSQPMPLDNEDDVVTIEPEEAPPDADAA